MKRNLLGWLLVVLVSGAIATYVLAQPVASTGTTGKIADAVTLLNDGKPQQAQELLATIAPGEPDYPAAQCYRLLCLHALKDYAGFLTNAESAANSLSALPWVTKKSTCSIDRFQSRF